MLHPEDCSNIIGRKIIAAGHLPAFIVKKW
jgi:hypothetical protein